jgi:sugar phosphate permease
MTMLEALKATPRVKSIQRAALAMLVLAGVINYIDRATLAVANLLIRQDLGLSIADMGYLLSAFLWAYAFAQLPTGAMVDKLGPRLLLACGLTLWSLAQLLGGLVQGFGQFFGARVLLGVGEAPQFPTGARVVRDWFNPRDRGLATGVFNCASSLGTAIAVPLLTFLMLSFGWRVMFISWASPVWRWRRSGISPTAIRPRSRSRRRRTSIAARAIRPASGPR